VSFRLADPERLFSKLATDPPQARADFAAAWRRAVEAGDDGAAIEAIAGTLLAINTEFLDFRGALTWCQRFDKAWTDSRAASAVALAQGGEPGGLRLCAAALIWPSLDHAGPGAQRNLQAVAQALATGLRLASEIDPDERFALAKSLLDYHGQQMDTHAAARLFALEHEQMLRSPPALMVQARWWFAVMAHHGYFGETAAAAHARERLQALIDAHALTVARFALLTVDMDEWLKTGQMQRAEKVHRDIDGLLPQLSAGHQPQGLRA